MVGIETFPVVLPVVVTVTKSDIAIGVFDDELVYTAIPKLPTTLPVPTEVPDIL